jgi:lipid-binding SYLF domain-containing protein
MVAIVKRSLKPSAHGGRLTSTPGVVTMRFNLLKAAAALGVTMLLAACASGDTAAEKRGNINQMRSETLAKLYALEPGARGQIAQAAGYGTFSNVGVNVVLLSAGGGWGVVHDNRSGKDTYLNMASAGVGLGLGVKDFRGVFVFTDPDALNWFVEQGWDASAQADAAAKTTDKGDAWAGAVNVAPGIRLYQITENGLALQATIQGTKYWKDSELN